MPEYQIILFHHFPTRRFFGDVKPVPDEFKHEIVIGHVKNDHHHSPLSPGYIEAILIADRKMIQELPVQFGFAMFVETDGDIQFGDAFVR